MLIRPTLALTLCATACGSVPTVDPAVDATPAPVLDASVPLPDAPPPPPDAPPDTTPPDTSLVAPGPLAAPDATRVVRFASDDPSASFRCALDGAAATSCTSPITTPTLADGDHVLAIAAVDPAGNVDPTPVEDRWRVDSTAPVVTFLARPPDPSNSANATVAWRSDELADFTCDLDGVAGPCGAGSAGARGLNGLTDGSHRFEVLAVDELGNRSRTAFTWTVDRTAPALRFVGTPPAIYDTAITFDYVASETVDFACSVIDDATGATLEPRRPCGAGIVGAISYDASLPGATQLRFTADAVDRAGNRATALEHRFCGGNALTCR